MQPTGRARVVPDMKRPHPALRAAILVGAVACLGLAMCAHSRAPHVASPANPAVPSKPQQAGEQAGGEGTPMKLEEGKMGKREEAGHFSATKAPGPLY